ncbi:MAG: hypothetical protein HGB21_14240 [Nitrospirae bacterium]|nr:hypothetical protein [Nitrospirota bacterium]NTW67443.1 hypothetical protein [Nitrospirota bacterium]
MKNIVLALLLALLLAGCAGLPAVHDPGDKGEEAVTITESHHTTKDAAFLAASSWLSEHYQGGKNIVQQSDKGSGTIAAKGPTGGLNRLIHSSFITMKERWSIR